jgi:hypothetical protein
VALVAGEDAVNLAVEGGDRGVEDAPGGVEMPGSEGVRIARETGPWKDQALGGNGQAGGTLARLERLVVGVALR